jgi:CheY-like chemotaxis protein
MTHAQVDRLFTAFEQADESISSRFGGTGLGLTISQTLVGYMGGAITVHSALGEGSTFSFTITMQKTDLAENRVEQADDVLFDLTGKRILIVDDVDINRTILIEILAETNVEIVEAGDGQEALDLFFNAPEYHFDFIFMDIQMPVMNGYQATEVLRASARPDAKTIPIVAMTANAYREDIDRALESGMNGHLPKPINFSELIRTLRSLLYPATHGHSY